MSNETVDAYYNRFKELFDEIQDVDGNIPVKMQFAIFSSHSGLNLSQFKIIIA
jgi:hypothetical protein